MSPLLYKAIGGLLVVMLIAGAGWRYGYVSATDKYAPQIAAANAALDTIDRTTKESVILQGKHNEKLFADEKTRTDRIHLYYKRLQLAAKGDNLPNPLAQREQSDDSAAIALNAEALGRELVDSFNARIELEYEAALIANQLQSWLIWRQLHNVPVQEQD